MRLHRFLQRPKKPMRTRLTFASPGGSYGSRTSRPPCRVFSRRGGSCLPKREPPNGLDLENILNRMSSKAVRSQARYFISLLSIVWFFGEEFSCHGIDKRSHFFPCALHHLVEQVELFFVVAYRRHDLKAHANDGEWSS